MSRLKRIERQRLDTKGDNEPNPSYMPVLEITELPSKFLAYPEGSKISYRPYTFGEVKVFNSSKVGLDVNMEFVLKGIECSFDKKDLTLSDFLYIGLLRKLSTFGTSKFSIDFICINKECKEKNTVQFTSEDIDFEELKIPELPIIFDSLKGELHFAPITVGEYIELVKEGKAEDEFELMIRQCKNLKSVNETREVLYDLPTSDGLILEQVDVHLYHEIKPFEFKCKKCNHNNIVAVEGGQTFVYPFREKRSANAKSRIHFGLQAKSVNKGSK